MATPLACLILGVTVAQALQLDAVCTRRAALFCSLPLASLHARPVSAAQKGAEDPYAMQLFDKNPCQSRTPLGACREQGPGEVAGAAAAPEPPMRVLQIQPEEESPLIAMLKQRSLDNADKNAQEVREKTLSARAPAQHP